MESTTPTPGPPPSSAPSPAGAAASGSRLALVAVALALLEVVLAWMALQIAEGAVTWCPAMGDRFGCSAVFRPRLSRLAGPITVSQVAFVGSMASLGFAFMLTKTPPAALVRVGLAGVGLGAGLAVGLQPLPWRATGQACPLCLVLAVLASALLVVVLPLTRRAGVSRAWGLGPLLVVLTIVGPFAAMHGARVADDDRERAARARAASGSEGPRVLLVTKERCPYCEGLLADVLGDERVVRVLQRTRGLEEVPLGDPRVPDGVQGAPTLIVIGRDGRERGRLVGYAYDPGAYATRLLTIVQGQPSSGR